MALPSGYKPVEYITCAGKQWFDTGIAPSANLAVEICVKPASAGLKENAILGASWSASGFFLMFYSNQVKFHSKGTSVQTSGFDTTAKSIIRCTQTSLVVNGTSYSLSVSGSDVTNTISLFNVTDAGIGSNNAAMYGDCYYCKMWQGTTLVRDYQPCLNSSGVPGMYDLVSGVFYPSTSGTAFTSGPITSDGRLEYIESNGTQYIDTGFKPNQNTRLSMVAQPTVTPATNQYRSFFGFRTNSEYFELIKADGNSLKVYFLYSNVVDTSKTFDINWTARTTFEINKNVATIGNTSATISSAPAFQSDYSIYLCASNYSGNADYLTPMRIYNCQIYDNGTLVRDYIPYRYNGEVGLWDRVSNTFFGNSGTGVFAAGPAAVYEKVEYIESSGTQYIDTGFVPTYQTRVVTELLMGAYSSVAFAYGSRTSNSSTTNQFVMGAAAADTLRTDYFGSKMTGSVPGFASGSTRVLVDQNKNVTTCNGTTITNTAKTSGTTSPYNLWLFTLNNAGSSTASGKLRLYSCLIYDNDVLVRDFVPVVRADGTVGLYDQLNEIFYENAGTGTFVAGPIAKYAKVEYIESTGTQYVDTQFIPNQDTRVVMDCQAFLTDSGGTFPFGVRASTNSRAFAVALTDSQVFYNYASLYSFADYPDTSERMVIDANAFAATFKGSTTVKISLSTVTFTCGSNLLLATASNGGAAYTGATAWNGRIYSCQIYDNDVLVRDYVPAVRADGIAGLYDQLNDVFYTNSGTGTFVGGPDLDYTKLEYIESSGTQYVDTGFKPNNNTRLTCGFEILATASSWRAVFGARDSGYTACFAIFASPDGQFQSNTGNGNSSYLFGDAVPVVGDHNADVNKNTTTIDGVSYTHAPVTFQNQIPLYLFADNEDGTASFFIAQKLRYCQIYDNGTLVRDYIPVLRGNGQIGLIDLVSGLFYANAGSGLFVAGPEIVDPDPPEPPGPYEPPSFTEQTLAYLAALRYPFYKLCRLRFLQPDGSTAFSLDNNPKNRRGGAFIADGSISANLQNGKRRNATVVLSNLDGSFDYNVNTVWFGTEIAIDEGLILPDGSEYYIQQGVFAIENPTEAVEPANRTATYNLVDKWSYLDGTLFGNLESTYEVPVGTNIFQPIEAILALDRGNGQPVDGATPIFTEYYNSKTQALPDGSTANLIDSPYTLRIDSDNGTYADILLGLAAMVNAWIGYDQTGALRIDPSQDDILDTNKPILWQFSMDEATFLGANYTVRNVDVYNDYIVLGELLDDNSQPAGRATNLDPRSDTNVQTIGRKTFRMSAPGFATDKQCQDLAVWKLKRSTSLQKAISISCSQLFHIEENGLVTIVRTDKPGSPVERHLVMGFTRPLTSNGEMQINAVSVQDFVTATVTSWPE